MQGVDEKMSQRAIHETAANVDTIRRKICAALAEGMKSGVLGFQFRFIERDGLHSEAWVYHHREHVWHKRAICADSAAVAEAMYDEFEAIARRDYKDDWTCRRVDHGEHTDFELIWRREAVESHPQENLESYLEGCLFYGHHDKGLDARRRIRFQGH